MAVQVLSLVAELLWVSYADAVVDRDVHEVAGPLSLVAHSRHRSMGSESASHRVLRGQGGTSASEKILEQVLAGTPITAASTSGSQCSASLVLATRSRFSPGVLVDERIS